MAADLSALEPFTYEQRFSGLSLVRKTIAGKEFDTCIFVGCSFVECIFDECKFLDCTFDECMISTAQLTNSSFVNVRFVGCKVIGVDWTLASVLSELSFDGCVLNFSTFNSLKLKKLVLKRCECKEADFIETDLTDSDFEGTDLERSRFQRANLTRANFRGAQRYDIDLQQNNVKGAKFSMPEVLSLLRVFGIVLVDSPGE